MITHALDRPGAFRFKSERHLLRLAGYEVYRFGGAELMKDGATRMLAEFFDRLAERMR